VILVSNQKPKFDHIDFILSFLQGDAGGCGFCPPATPGLQGDRGSQGYRGRPGVSII
jgi:hypothetical protein